MELIHILKTWMGLTAVIKEGSTSGTPKSTSSMTINAKSIWNFDRNTMLLRQESIKKLNINMKSTSILRK